MSQEDQVVENGSDESESPIIRDPHLIKVVKNQQGFGFNVRGQVSEGGQLKSIGGQLYAPMQYISQVLEGGPADEAGLKVGDRILEINGQPVEGTEHQSVVQVIRQSGKIVTLLVISVTDEEARRLEPETTGVSAMDYFERRSVPVSVPDTQKLSDTSGKEYIGFNIYLANKFLITKRYREFDSLNTNLKRQFNDFIFPKLPGKRPFTLNDTQVDTRRRGLEDYLDKVCSARVIFDSDLLQDFLELKKPAGASASGADAAGVAAPLAEKSVDFRVTLPDHSVTMVTIKEQWRTREVFEMVAKKIGLNNSSMKYFALFQRTEHDFDRKLQSTEFPHQIYVKKYASRHTGESCIYLRKWLFTRSHEVVANSEPVVLNLFYNQAVEDVSKGKIAAGEHLSQLKTLKSQEKKEQYLDVVRSLPNYCSMEFPHCACDARKVGHVIVIISFDNLKLKACSTEGVLESQEHTFTWNMISNYEADLEEQTFTFQYSREGKEPRWVKVHSAYYRYMEECVDRINEEILWKQPDGSAHLSSEATPISTAKLVNRQTASSNKSSNKLKVSAITDDDL